MPATDSSTNLNIGALVVLSYSNSIPVNNLSRSFNEAIAWHAAPQNNALWNSLAARYQYLSTPIGAPQPLLCSQLKLTKYYHDDSGGVSEDCSS